METYSGIIDFSREEKIEEKDINRIIEALKTNKKLKGNMSLMSDGNFVSFDIETEQGDKVLNFVTDFNSLVGLCQEVGFETPISNKEPSDEEKKQIQEDLKDDGFKTYLEESKEDFI